LFPPEPLPATEQNQIDVRGPYLEMLRGIVDIDMIRRSTLTFFVDAMSGTTSGVIPAIIGEGAQTRAIEINRDSDPLLGRQTPTPIETTMTRVRKLVKDSDSHLGIAISADGRALGVTDNTGELASTLEVALLLGQHLARQHRERGLIVVPSLGDELPGVRAWEQATGNKVEFAADPVARIAEITSQDRTNPLVGMTAGGEVIVGRYSATFDAMLAGLLLIEMIAYSNNKLRAPLDELRSRLNQQSA
jgi:phosphomannomutase